MWLIYIKRILVLMLTSKSGRKAKREKKILRQAIGAQYTYSKAKSDTFGLLICTVRIYYFIRIISIEFRLMEFSREEFSCHSRELVIAVITRWSTSNSPGYGVNCGNNFLRRLRRSSLCRDDLTSRRRQQPTRGLHTISQLFLHLLALLLLADCSGASRLE